MTCPHCGAASARSVPQLRRFFSVIRAAYHHWPEDHIFQPDSREQLRAWLLCNAGWKTEVTMEVSNRQTANAAALAAKALMQATGNYCWVTAGESGRDLRIVAPKSISFAKAEHKRICKVFETVEHIISAALNVRDCDELLKETERAA